MSTYRLMSATRWGAAWLDAVFRVWPEAKRHAKGGRLYARTGRVGDVRIDGGVVAARVLGHRRVPYAVMVTLRPIRGDVWRAAMASIALDGPCAAQVRDGVVPRAVLSHFDAAGDSLLPLDTQALHAQCPCSARVEMCDHVLAVHHWIAAAIERDPFMMFAIRGSSRERVLDWLDGVGRDTPVDVEERVYHLLGPEAADAAFDEWRMPAEMLQDDTGSRAYGDAILAQLGDPLGWDMDASCYETLLPVYRAAARYARAITHIGGSHSSDGASSEGDG